MHLKSVAYLVKGQISGARISGVLREDLHVVFPWKKDSFLVISLSSLKDCGQGPGDRSPFPPISNPISVQQHSPKSSVSLWFWWSDSTYSRACDGMERASCAAAVAVSPIPFPPAPPSRLTMEDAWLRDRIDEAWLRACRVVSRTGLPQES